jgi:4-amino-4-deoxy-L-arabinose transferase-like glycosyltransferase
MSRQNIIVLLICLAAIALRCWRIDAPFTDAWSWRQSDVAAIARNYFENGFHFARPQIDWAGNEPGFVGTEFPILPFTTAIVYKFTGVHEWIGRLQTITIFAFSLPFFFAIVRRAFDETAASCALIFYSFAPLSVAAGRAFMPDVPSLSFALAGLYFFWRDVDTAGLGRGAAHDFSTADRGGYNLLIGSAMIALALLIKLPTAVIAAPMAALAWRKFGGAMFRRPRLWLFGAIALVPSLLWYWHAHRIAEQCYPYHFFGAGGVRVMNFGWYRHIAVQTFISTLTPILFVLAAAGLVISRNNPDVAPFRWWLIAMTLFIVIVGYGNRHQWYQLPLVPIAAGFGGAAVSFAAKKWNPRVVIASVVMLFLASSIIPIRQFFTPAAQPLRQLGRALHDRTPADALIVAADDGDPTALYYAHRKGWHFLERDGLYNGNPSDSMQIVTDLKELRRRGATHLVFYRGTMWWLDYYTDFAEYLARTSVLEGATAEYRIYRLIQ